MKNVHSRSTPSSAVWRVPRVRREKETAKLARISIITWGPSDGGELLTDIAALGDAGSDTEPLDVETVSDSGAPPLDTRVADITTASDTEPAEISEQPDTTTPSSDSRTPSGDTPSIEDVAFSDDVDDMPDVVTPSVDADALPDVAQESGTFDNPIAVDALPFFLVLGNHGRRCGEYRQLRVRAKHRRVGRRAGVCAHGRRVRCAYGGG